MDNISTVRLKSSDKPSFFRETFIGDAVRSIFQMKHEPISADFPPAAWVNNVLQEEPPPAIYDAVQGLIQLIPAPLVNSDVVIHYYSTIFTNAEVQLFLDEAGGDTNLATAKLLMAWATDSGRIAKKETLSGGGGLGNIVKDTSVTADQLRASAQAYLDHYNEFAGTNFPVEAITEVPWTEQTWNRQAEQEIIRNS